MKGQTQQVFIYLMVILVVGAVLLFGYKSIHNIMNKSCDVDQAAFQSDLKKLLEDNSGYGDMSSKPIKAPCAYEELCFLDSNTANISSVSAINNDLIEQEVTVKTGNNVFLVKGDKTIVLYSLDYLSVPGKNFGDGFICIKSKGNNFYFALEGIGKGKVQITPSA
jgi:hypothetical protein